MSAPNIINPIFNATQPQSTQSQLTLQSAIQPQVQLQPQSTQSQLTPPMSNDNKSKQCDDFKKPSYNPFKMNNLKGIGVLILSSIVISIIWGIFGLIAVNIMSPSKGNLPIILVLSVIMFIITALSHVALYNRWMGCYFKVDNE
jgi:hypothetical protein